MKIIKQKNLWKTNLKLQYCFPKQEEDSSKKRKIIFNVVFLFEVRFQLFCQEYDAFGRVVSKALNDWIHKPGYKLRSPSSRSPADKTVLYAIL